MAFICSSLATFALIFAGVPAMELPVRVKYIQISHILLINQFSKKLDGRFWPGVMRRAGSDPVSRFLAIVVSVICFIALLFGHMELKQAYITVCTVVARVGVSGLSKRHLASSAFVLYVGDTIRVLHNNLRLPINYVEDTGVAFYFIRASKQNKLSVYPLLSQPVTNKSS
jgi:hypothetical protein